MNLREDVLTSAINGWIGELFRPDNRDETVRALVASQNGQARSAASDTAKKRLTDAETALRRLQDAILAGVDPAAVRDAINAAQAQRETVRAEMAAVPGATRLTDAEVYAMIDAVGDVGGAIERARPDSLAKLYRDLGIEVSYRRAEGGGFATIGLRVVNERVRGGIDHYVHGLQQELRWSTLSV